MGFAYLTAIGAATALSNAVTAAAAARARLVRFGPLPGLMLTDEIGEAVPLIGAPAGEITRGFENDGRLVRLAVAALDDLEHSAGSVDWARAGLLIALTAPPGVGPGWAAELAGKIRRASLLAGKLPLGSVQSDERSGTLRAVGQAILALAQLDHVVVLAVDSSIDDRKWDVWQAELRLKTPDNPVGFLPGEAAVAVLLSKSDAGQPTYSNLRLHAPVVEREAPEGRPSGRGLSRALLAAVPQGAATLYVDLNGEESRAHDFGCALTRLPNGSPLREAPIEIAALAFGETGAASPLLGVLLGVRAFARGYAAGSTAVILCAGDDGARAALTLDRLQRR